MERHEKAIWGRANLRSYVGNQQFSGLFSSWWSGSDDVSLVDCVVDYFFVVESRGGMRTYYSDTQGAPSSAVAYDGKGLPIPTRARVAIYDSPASAPRVIDVDPGPILEYLEDLTTTVYRLAQEQESDIPFTVIREICENFLHAGFSEPVVSILDKGRTLRFADQGPGFHDGAKALKPGFTTATTEMKCFIRGVGSGLPIVSDYLGFCGGSILIEDNLGSGSVVTISSVRTSVDHPTSADVFRATFSTASDTPLVSEDPPSLLTYDDTTATATPLLTTRQKQVLALVMESGSNAGPSLVSKELDVGISTAYRDLASLEEFGLIAAEKGKRRLTTLGISYLDSLTARS